jgi:FixJ family two-component response regulator
VDDEAVVSRQLVDGLTLSGFLVRGVASSAEALAALEADPTVAAVITDIRMPGLDGLALAQRIMRDRSEEQAIEVVVMTGHATIDDAAAAVRTRVCDFLRKPFRLVEAARAVEIALERAGSRRRSALERNLRLAQLRHLEVASNEAAEDKRRGSLVNQPADRDMHAISHALRTPLTAIAGGAELLVGPSNADNPTEYLTMLLNGVRQAREAVELLEEFHEAGRDTAPAPQTVFSLDAIVERAVRRLRPVADRRASTLEAAILPPIILTGLRPNIERAIDHCILESLDWAKPNSVIRLNLEKRSSNRAVWAVLTVLVMPGGAVWDAGPPADVAFPETSSLWSRTQEGLRFSIARRLVEAHEGRITSWNGSEGMMALRIAIPV